MAAPMDSWVREHDEAVGHIFELRDMISEGSSLPQSGRQARQHSAALRRKICILENKLDSHSLLAKLPLEQSLTKKEMNRRRNMVAKLRSEVIQMSSTLSMTNFSNRNSLLEPEIESADAMSRSAGLDNQQILDLQRQIMKEQDDSLDQLEEIVTSISHNAQAVNEELDLHASLLDDLEERVEVTESKLKKLLKRILNKVKEKMCMG